MPKRSQGDALRRINIKLKELRRKYPNRDYSVLRKQASAMYRRGELGKKAGKSRSGKNPFRKIKGVTASRKLKSTLKKEHMRLPHGYATVKRKRVGSVSAHIADARHLIIEDIGILESKLFKATTAKSKRDLRKRITRLKSQYRKLC